MSISKNVRGYIFRTRLGRYFLQPGKGEVMLKEFAHVYTAEEAGLAAGISAGWGGKKEGKWIIVYE